MDVVLGVSMAPAAVRMVLVEGTDAGGITVDHHCVGLSTDDAAASVIAAILGTRDSAIEGGHHIVATGVVWTDHAAAARLTKALRANGVDDVVLVSELHAAGALAQVIGRAGGYEHTAIMLLDRATATLAVVRTVDGAVVMVASRSLHATDAVAELRTMIAGLHRLTTAPQALFLAGCGIDVAALKPKIAEGTTLPVHAPVDSALALARGAALAAVAAPRFEACTVGMLPTDETVGMVPTDETATVAGITTQRAPVGYLAPLGYSAVPDEESDDYSFDPDDTDDAEPEPAPERDPFLRVGSALLSIFVIGVFALVASLVITIGPTADQRADPGENAVVSSSQASVPTAPETIANPLPVVQEAPRTVFVTPAIAPPPAPRCACTGGDTRSAGPGPRTGGPRTGGSRTVAGHCTDPAAVAAATPAAVAAPDPAAGAQHPGTACPGDVVGHPADIGCGVGTATCDVAR